MLTLTSPRLETTTTWRDRHDGCIISCTDALAVFGLAYAKYLEYSLYMLLSLT